MNIVYSVAVADIDSDGDMDIVSGSGTVEDWSIETVDSVDDVGKYSSIALDSNGYPHMSYYSITGNDLKYAKWTGTSWNIETVDSANSVGAYSSITLDSNDYPHISYYKGGDLMYVTKIGASWTPLETVDNTGNVGEYASLALDSNDTPHISYYDSKNGALKYATKSGGAWVIETIDDSGDVGLYTSLALDSGSTFGSSIWRRRGRRDRRTWYDFSVGRSKVWVS